MDIIFSHKSALEFWRRNGNVNINTYLRKRRKNLPSKIPRLSEIRDATTSLLSYPVSLIVAAPKARRKSRIVQSHVHAGHIPDWSLININDGIAVCSPAFCFLQMAGELPLIKLIELGFELCGSYSLAAKSDYDHGIEAVDTNLYGHHQLTNTKALKTFTAQMKGVNGRKKAFRALRYIADGSASPMETILVMLLTLPHKLGGYGIPAPELNKRINLSNADKRKSGKSFYICDLSWPKAGLAIEYDSDFYHTGADRISSDSKRRLELAALGITVITVTNGQIRNAVDLESLARLISGKVGKQMRYKNPQFQKARRELGKLLLG